MHPLLSSELADQRIADLYRTASSVRRFRTFGYRQPAPSPAQTVSHVVATIRGVV